MDRHRRADVVCVLRGPVGLGVVDALARLAVQTRRSGVGLRVSADAEAGELLALVGVEALLAGCGQEPPHVEGGRG